MLLNQDWQPRNKTTALLLQLIRTSSIAPSL
jgi:hypothetical protein